MNLRENAMAVFHHEKPERIPWWIYDWAFPSFLPRGSWERELRNKGLCLYGLDKFLAGGPSYTIETPNVEVVQRSVAQGTKKVVTTTYNTPVGSVSKKERLDLNYLNPWTMEFMIKDISDYEVVKFIHEDTTYRPNYQAFEDAERNVGDDGFCVAAVGYTPFHEALFHIMGYQRVAIDLYTNPEEFEKLFRVVEKKFYEVCRMVADSPAEIVQMGDNLNGRVTSPRLFERFCMPIYRKATQIFHQKGKIVMVHMDGALDCLKELIPKTGIDVVEAFTPPPVGDLPISEARASWGDKIIIMINFPEPVCLLGVDAIKKCTLEILRSIAPGDGFMLSITEDIPQNILEESMRTITEVMWEHGKYPIKL